MVDDSGSSKEDYVQHVVDRYRVPRRWDFGAYDQEELEVRMKVNLPTFNGWMDVEKFLDWMKNVENFFKYANTPKHKKVQIVAFKLQGGASAWWTPGDL